MPYAIIQFVEKREHKVTLVRPERGQPMGGDGVMDQLSAFIEESSAAILREGSPGAQTMAMAFFTREMEAGRQLRILGAEGEWGITREEIEALAGPGYYYEVDFGGPGDRSRPQVLSSGIEDPKPS